MALRVSAGAQDLGDTSVFWMIATPGLERPWDTPFYVAPARLLNGLSAGATTRLQWLQTPLALPPGTYEVSAWVHKILPSGDTQHVAGGAVGTFSVTQPVPSAFRLGAESFKTPDGPLTFDSLSLDQPSPSAQLVSVQVTVRNRGAEPVTGRAQVVVNRFTDPEPFRTAFWQTDWQDVRTLNPGESSTLAWTSTVGLPAGTYGLSVWLHSRIDAAWEHSQATFNIPLKLGPNLSRVQRARPATSATRIAEARLVDGRQVQLVVDNDGPERAVSARAERLPDRRRFDWQLTALEPQAALGDYALGEHSQSVLQLPVRVDCAAEDRLVHVALFAQASLESLDDVLVDACV